MSKANAFRLFGRVYNLTKRTPNTVIGGAKNINNQKKIFLIDRKQELMHPSEETLLAKVFVPSHIRRNLVVPKEIEKVLELEIVGMPFHGPASDNNARFRFANRERTLFFSSSEHLFPLTSPCAVTASCIVWKALNNLNTYVVLAEPHYGVVKPACTVVPTHASATTALGKAYRGTSIVFAALVLFYPPVFF